MKIEDLNLSALKYFLDAVELDSITLSSERNHVSRPAVSQAILRLEDWYGHQLLAHKKRDFALTDEGIRFHQMAKHSFENLKKGFKNTYAPDFSLHIGCSASLIELVFPKIQSQVKKCPQPVIKIGPTHQLKQMLEQKQINIAFLISTSPKSNFNTFEFYSGNFELRSKSGRLAEPLIVTEKRPEVEAFAKFSAKTKLPLNHQIEVESWTVASRLAEMTDGTCLVPDYLPKASLKSVPMKAWKYHYSAQVLYRKKSLLSEVELELIEKLTR